MPSLLGLRSDERLHERVERLARRGQVDQHLWAVESLERCLQLSPALAEPAVRARDASPNPRFPHYCGPPAEHEDPGSHAGRTRLECPVPKAPTRDVDEFLVAFADWAGGREDVVGGVLVGSHARGTARPDSDVDVVILAKEPLLYLDDTTWVEHFGRAASVEREDYGMVQSLRAIYRDGLEVEFGLTVPAWAATAGLAAGTREVFAGGFRILHDPLGLLASLRREVTGPG